jgi:hypothetical protein
VPVRKPYAGVDFILQSGIYEFGYWRLLLQAVHNYKKKSTEGWSIGNILLDFSGT